MQPYEAKCYGSFTTRTYNKMTAFFTRFCLQEQQIIVMLNKYIALMRLRGEFYVHDVIMHKAYRLLHESHIIIPRHGRLPIMK